MDVAGEISVRPGESAAGAILAESARCGAGMIAIGAPGPRRRGAPARDDVTLKVVAAYAGPVLIVPESSW
jgi:nucleotide-binding universal stress UspA family protein